MNRSGQRAIAASAQLIAVHDWLRDELARLRDRGPGDEGTARLGTGMDLRSRCLAFCGAVTEHHTSEDADVFTVLATEEPKLAPVLEELRQDHVVIAEALARLDEVLRSDGGGPPDAGPTATRTQLHTIAALLETHFTYEERKIAAALDVSSVDTIRPDPVPLDASSVDAIRPRPSDRS